ncbi:MAG: ABC transporter ATP-binding protein [Lachnospiraceae bacterium]|nr:ABC transporter ATP-binding protein [Lachnospiraceae bacterium]
MEKMKERSTFSWVFAFAGQKRSKYVLSVILAIMGAVCQMLPYLVVAYMVQKLLEGNHNFKGYLIDCLAMTVMWLLRVLFHALSTSASHVATFAVLGNIRKRGLDKLARMPLGDVQERGSGELKNILVERIDSIETTLAHVIPEVSSNIFAVVGMLVYLFVIDWRMALGSLVTFPIGMLCFVGMMIGYDENYGRTVRAVKNLNDTAVEYIGGIEVIKVFGKAKSSYEKFVAAVKEGAASYVDWMRKCNLFYTFAMNIMPATLITVLPMGGILVRNGSLALSDFILIIIIAMGLITPIIGCMSYNDDLAKLHTVMGEVTAIIDAKEMKRPAKSQDEPERNTIQLSEVHFGYGEKEILHGINLTLWEGTVNAFVGPSGGGKSTIAKLIASYWDVNSGKITVGGVDIRKLPMEYYQKMVAYVSQDNFLFDDTIRENIRMGNLAATDEEVEQAAKDCGCYDFIMNLENGFDTVAGSGGGLLSGGEKQRICIARAMLKDAPIVILDEATAYTDPENEAVIQTSIAKLVQGKTLIVIAHRLSTIIDADQIVVVEQGKINATGTHEELLVKSDLYQKLWDAHISSKDSLTGGEAHA